MSFSRLLSTILIYLISLQMAFGNSFIETQKISKVDTDKDLNYDELMSRMEDYKKRIAGFDITSSCSDKIKSNIEKISSNSFDEDDIIRIGDNTEKKWLKILDDIKAKGCNKRPYTYDKVEVKCVYKRVPGLIEKISKKILDAEKNGNEETITLLTEDDPVTNSLLEEGHYYRNQILRIIKNTDIEKKEKQEMILAYLGNIALQFRDFIIVRRGYTDKSNYGGKKLYNSLVGESFLVPTELFPHGSEVRRIAILGISPSTEPFSFDVHDFNNGDSLFKYNQDILKRDILTLMKGVTTKNYIRALKWMTLQMILNQITVYKIMLGERGGVEIPNSCQNHFNGDLPKRFDVQINKFEGEKYIDSILKNQHLLLSEEDGLYREYFLDNINNDPLEDGYSGITAFEKYQSARAGLRLKDVSYGYSYFSKKFEKEPDFDDYSDFKKVLNYKIAEAFNVFKDKFYVGVRGQKRKKSVTYDGLDIFKKIITVPDTEKSWEIKDKKTGKIRKRVLGKSNVSVYLAELMQRKGALNVEDVVPDHLKIKLKRNNVKIALPALYGSSHMRRWGLRLIANFAKKYKDKKVSGTIRNVISKSCGNNPVCQVNDRKKSFSSNVLTNIYKKLENFSGNYEYTPTRRVLVQELEADYNMFGVLWNYLRDSNADEDFSKATIMSEWSYLRKQHSNGNPWARLRLSYLLALDELEPFAKKPTNLTHACFGRNIKTKYKKIKEAGKKLRLHLVLRPAHGNRVLLRSEKEEFWKGLIGENESETEALFTYKDENEIAYYKHFDKVSSKTILTRESFDKFLSEELPFDLRNEEEQEANHILNSEFAKKGSFFYKLYSMRGNIKKQKNLYEKFSKENGIDTAYSAKLSFLELDNALKRPIYRSLIKDAAKRRMGVLEEQLDQFCANDFQDNDRLSHEQMQALFWSMAKQQNKLNQMAGIQGSELVEKVMSKVGEMSSEEWKDMGIGLLAASLAIGAIVVGSACAAATAGICTPLSVGMIGMGVGALYTQGNLVRREYERKKNADGLEKQVKLMEGLGFAKSGDSYNVSRSWGWTVFESVSMIPFLSLAGKTVSVSSKVVASIGQSVARQTGKKSFSSIAKNVEKSAGTIIKENDDLMARKVLGLESFNQNMMSSTKKLLWNGKKWILSNSMYQQTVIKINKLKSLQLGGQISLNTMLKGYDSILKGLKSIVKKGADETVATSLKVVEKVGVREIDLATAKTVNDHFNGNIKFFSNYLKSYTTKLSGKNFITGNWKKIFVDRIEHAKHITKKAKEGKYLYGTNWFKKVRYEHLAEYGDELLKVMDDLGHLESSGNLLLKNGTKINSLESYVFQNIDTIGNILFKLPFRKRDLPYMILLQGGPLFVEQGMKKLPSGFGRAFGMLTDGITVRKIFQARDRLIVRSFEKEIDRMLGLSKFEGAVIFADIFKGLDEYSQKVVSKMDEAARNTFLTKKNIFQATVAENAIEIIEKKIGQKKFSSLLSKGLMGKNNYKLRKDFLKLNKKEMIHVLFNAKTPTERGMRNIIWKGLDVKELFQGDKLWKNLDGLASKAIKELADFKNIDEFEELLRWFQIRTASNFKQIGVIDIM